MTEAWVAISRVVLPVLPVADLWLCWIVLGSLMPAAGWGRALLRAGITLGAWAVLVAEGLSLAGVLTRSGLAICWLTLLVALIAGVLILQKRAILRFPNWAFPASRSDRWLVAGVGLMVGVTAVVAWLAPPNTWDSLNYHMSRVAHWAQNGSLAPYATGIEIQNGQTPGAEILILHLLLLAGSDRLSNFVEWGAMLGSLASVMVLARQLGAGRLGSLCAAVFAATLPMGIVQASSTMTDYVVAVWVVCAAVEVVGFLTDRPTWAGTIFAAAAAGLALLTKATAFVLILPLGVTALVAILRRGEARRVLGRCALAAAVVLALNGSYLWRTYVLYGSPFSGGGLVQAHANRALTAQAVASNLLRHVAMELGTPSPHINKAIFLAVRAAHEVIGIDLNDRRTTMSKFEINAPGTNELLTINPAHMFLVLLALAWLPGLRRTHRRLLIYAAVLAAGFLLYCLMFRWQVFAGRYHLPFFIFSAPLVAVVGESRLRERTARWLCLLLLLLSLPWLVGVRQRPLIPLQPDGVVGSILVEPRTSLLFANNRGLERPYTAMTQLIEASGCRDVGVALSGNSAEYPLWALLGEPWRGAHRIEWIVDGTPSAQLRDPAFEPCALICESCPASWQDYQGLTEAYRRGSFRLFLAGEPIPGEGSS